MTRRTNGLLRSSVPVLGVSGRLVRGTSCAGIAVVVLAAAFAGYHQMMTTHTLYDDEGYIMQSLASFMQGDALYERTYTQYGPVPFLAGTLLHRVTGLPISHDVTRIRTLVTWIGVAACAGLLAARLTGSRWMLLVGFVVAFLHLERLCLQPGHPQDLCALGLVVSALLVSGRAGTPSPVALVAVGIVAGAILMTKLNIGTFLLASLGLIVLLQLPRTTFVRSVQWGLFAGILLVPFVLMRAHLRAPGGLLLPIVVASSMLAIFVVATRDARRATLTVRGVVPFAAAVLVTALLAMVAICAAGTSGRGLWYGLTGVHRDFVKYFSTPPPLVALVVPWSVVMLVASIFARARWAVAVARGGMIAALALACVRFVVETYEPLVLGLVDRGASGALVGLAGPAMWVLLRSKDEGLDDAGRLALVAIAGLQPLGAYPTPGPQMAVGSLLIAIGCIVALSDAVEAAAVDGRARRTVVAAAALALVGIVLLRDVELRRRSQTYAALRLPGSTLVRMEKRKAARYRWLARTLRERTETFVFAEHALNSFYFWTDRPPPTGLNPTYWPFMLSDEQQMLVVDALRTRRRVGIVHAPYSGELPDSPLRAYIDERFAPAVTDGYFHVWLPKTSAPH